MSCCPADIEEECVTYYEVTGRAPQQVLLGIRAHRELMGCLRGMLDRDPVQQERFRDDMRVHLQTGAGRVLVVPKPDLDPDALIPCRFPTLEDLHEPFT